MDIQQALTSATELFKQKEVESPELSAELLVAHVTRCERTKVLADLDHHLSPIEERELENVKQRRVKHEPVPYITGKTEFFSYDFKIVKGVFIPRPETETLVEEALKATEGIEVPKILDVGTGCGNILIAMAHNLEDGEFHGTDISNTAIKCAQQNIRDHELVNFVTLYEGNMFQALRGSLIKNFDVIVTNPPYIKTGDISSLSAQIRNFEPIVCLDGGREGLNFYRPFIDNIAPLLAPEGRVCMEIDPTLVEPVSTLVERKKIFTTPEVTTDLAGKERVLTFGLK